MKANTYHLINDRTGVVENSESALAVDCWFQTIRHAVEDYELQKEKALKRLLEIIPKLNELLLSKGFSLAYFYDFEPSSDGATWPELSIQCLKMKEGKYYFYGDIEKKCLILPFDKDIELERVDPDNYPSNEIIKDFPLDKGIDCPNIGRA